MKTTVGQNIKNFRKSFGLTQEQLSDRTGLSRGQIKNWEVDRHEPDLESLKVLASFFNTSIDRLLSFEDVKEDALLELVQRAYEELDGLQQGRFAKQVSLYVKMLRDNKDIL
ncbi:hypothetical protein BTJ45_03538 [Bacillus mycoides]|nr:hypothetical protein BTJ45_03538 [Bacillus mycoides]